jgi:uncharacterized membrane protein HdeD (DUF308 family)
MNSKFPILSFLSFLLRFIGWMTVLSGVVYIGSQYVTKQNMLNQAAGMELAVGIAAIIIGLMIAAIGESIGVLFAIEENTRGVTTIQGSTKKIAANQKNTKIMTTNLDTGLDDLECDIPVERDANSIKINQHIDYTDKFLDKFSE